MPFGCDKQDEKEWGAGASRVTTKASESEKLKIHLPIVSQLFNFWSANKRASSAAPRCQALSELGLSRAAGLSPERQMITAMMSLHLSDFTLCTKCEAPPPPLCRYVYMYRSHRYTCTVRGCCFIGTTVLCNAGEAAGWRDCRDLWPGAQRHIQKVIRAARICTVPLYEAKQPPRLILSRNIRLCWKIIPITEAKDSVLSIKFVSLSVFYSFKTHLSQNTFALFKGPVL